MVDNMGFLIYSFAIFALLVGVIILIPTLSKAHNNEQESYRLQVRQLYFVSGMVGVLGLIFLEAMGMYYFENNMNITDNAGKNIFEACLKTIPPLITLVLGYYFGKKSS